MDNPFVEIREKEDNDIELICNALKGNGNGLTRLVLRHQAWIYNIAYKMVSDPNDAEDITQEILIKMITKLSTYDPGKSSFRTWLYRIVANHVINMKKKKYEKVIFNSHHITDYCLAAGKIPDDSPYSHPENGVLVEEAKTGCLTGMLLCLDRRQRLVFILGEIFDVSASIGGEILEISESSFRQILSRSRKKIYAFLNENCGLVNKDNPCRCYKQIEPQIQIGWLSPDKIASQSHRDNRRKISEAIRDKVSNFEEQYYSKYVQLFRDQPFHEPPDLTRWISTTLKDDNFKDLFLLGGVNSPVH
ncbi:MAG: RNA polymerase sigma factor [Syntrophales bacterium]|nr:RNA polymerase sigma factor [Syntrophales bacterium]